MAFRIERVKAWPERPRGAVRKLRAVQKPSSRWAPGFELVVEITALIQAGQRAGQRLPDLKNRGDTARLRRKQRKIKRQKAKIKRQKSLRRAAPD